MNFHTQQQNVTVAEVNYALAVNYYNIAKSAVILRALNHKLRQEVIKTIHRHNGLTVTQLYVKLRLEQSVASQHLAILRRAAVVSTERETANVFTTQLIKKD